MKIENKNVVWLAINAKFHFKSNTEGGRAPCSQLLGDRLRRAKPPRKSDFVAVVQIAHLTSVDSGDRLTPREH